MLSPDGNPYVPPTCPEYGHGDIPDLSDVPLEISLHAISRDPRLEVIGSFGLRDENGDHIDLIKLGIDYLPRDSALAQQLLQLAGIGSVTAEAGTFEEVEVSSADNPALQQLRQRLCGRVAMCRGITDAGECWALGKTGVEETLQQLFADEQTSGEQ